MRTWKNRTIRRHQRDARYYYLGVRRAWTDMTQLPLIRRLGLAVLLIFRGKKK